MSNTKRPNITITFSENIAEFNNVIRNAQPSWQEWGEQIAKEIEQLINTPEWSKVFQSIGETIEKNFADVGAVYRESETVFAEAGFWFAPSMTGEFFGQVKQLHDKGKLTSAILRKILVDYYEANNWEALREAVNDWERNTQFEERSAIFNDALDAHIMGKYTLSIPTLLPQVEGVTRALFGDPTGEDNLSTIIKPFFEDWPIIMGDAFIAYVTGQVFIRTKKPDFVKLRATLASQGHTPLNRNGILHGFILDYANKENSLRAFLMLDSLSLVASSETS